MTDELDYCGGHCGYCDEKHRVWEQKAEELRKENDTLRGLLAKGTGACAYCGLPAEDIAKCAHGFPGCGRMDDIIGAPILQAEATLAHVRLSLEKLLEKL